MTLLTPRILRIGAVSGAALLTVACAETQLGAQAVKEVARTETKAEPVQELAPDAFDVTGLTIWDGASTLEGVWVAHPLAQRAQRVRVTNEENDLAIEGAMFRRDPTLSGPSILVSSDAARLLGLEPGIPTELRIIALREGVYAQPTTAAAAPVETGAVETAALPAPEPVETEPVETASEEAPATETANTEPVFERSNDAEPAETAAPAPAEVAEAQPATANPPARQPTPPKTAITAADLRGETAPASPPAPAPPEPAPTQPEPAQQAAVQAPTPKPAVPAPTPAVPAPTPAIPAPTPTPAASSSGVFKGTLPSGQFVQAGAFGVEPNAATLVQTLRGAGLPAQYVQRDINGSLLNIVMIGPLADDAAADAAVVAAAKAGAPGARKVTR